MRVGTIRKGAPPPDQAEQIGGPPSTRPLSRRAADIVATARILLEKEGVDALTMRRLAGELGIRAPSLYKHLPGKEAIRVALIEVAFSEIGAALHASLAQQEGTSAASERIEEQNHACREDQRKAGGDERGGPGRD